MTQQIDGATAFVIEGTETIAPADHARFMLSFPDEAVAGVGKAPGDLPPTDLIITPSIIHMNMGAAEAAKHGGRPWITIDIDAVGRLTDTRPIRDHMNHAETGVMGQHDPAVRVTLLQRARDLRAVGHETVNGVPAVHYTGTVDTALLRAHTAESLGITPEDYQRLVRKMTRYQAQTSTVDVWTGPDGRLVRQSTTMTATLDNRSFTLTETVDYTAWDVPVDTTAPRARDAVRLTDLAAPATG